MIEIEQFSVDRIISVIEKGNVTEMTFFFRQGMVQCYLTLSL